MYTKRTFSDIYIQCSEFHLSFSRCWYSANKFRTLMRRGLKGNGRADGYHTRRPQGKRKDNEEKRNASRTWGWEETVRFKMPLTADHTPLSRCLRRICLRAPMRPQFSLVLSLLMPHVLLFIYASRNKTCLVHIRRQFVTSSIFICHRSL